ncbi:hypothetical protein AGMMS49983_13790 [Clostridia bacterium]|nr:hypothetical protein AGMMS49983_13790 [Clostridia bacterium]
MDEQKHIINELGLDKYETKSYGIYFEKKINGSVLNGSFDGKKEEILPLLPHIKKVFGDFSQFDKKAHTLIQNKSPDEDASELVAGDIIFYSNGDFSIGYDAGDSPAGELYLYVKFDSDFTMYAELIYECY